MNKLCIGIPNYNHGSTIAILLEQLADYHLPCILVDDGSDAKTKALLNAAVEKFTWVTLLTLPENLGKGGAMQAAIAYAKNQGYTHMLQIDADGQHDINDIPQFIAASKQHPKALVTGTPRFDDTVPKSRLYGRKITQWWVTIETLSTEIQDAMCGFRIYPIESTMAIIRQFPVGKRMDFDIEILVRLHWQGIKIISLPTSVKYPADGISHFKLWHDNIVITQMHTRLFFGMLMRLPRLMMRKIKFSLDTEQSTEQTNSSEKYFTLTNDIEQPKQEKNWHQLQERGTKIGIYFMLLCYRLLGRKTTYLLLYPITCYFYVFNKTARRASKDYLARIQQFEQPKPGTEQSAHTNDIVKPSVKLSTFRHLMTFAESIVDKLAVWNQNITLAHIEIHGQAILSACHAKNQGGIIFTAHLGNIEIARALSRLVPELKVNALVFNRHAMNINNVLTKVNKDYRFNMIEVQKLDIPLAMRLQEKIDAGEFVVVAADRTPVATQQRLLTVSFLNQAAHLPQGAFILASILKCPSYFMLCLKERNDKFSLYFEHLCDEMSVDRENRHISLTHYAQCYTDRLSEFCQRYPLQWFNFYNFWQMQNNNFAKKGKL